MKKMYCLIAIFFITTSASATEVCEIGTVATLFHGKYDAVTLNCTDWKLFDDVKIFYLGPYFTEDGAPRSPGPSIVGLKVRILIKKTLIDAGYHEAPQCAVYETYIKP